MKRKKFVWILSFSLILILTIVTIFIFCLKPKNGYDFNQMKVNDDNVTYEKILMANSYQKEKGINGAGCQWPTVLQTSSDGSLMLYGTDVSGIYRSLDHGKNWSEANVNIGNMKITAISIDPNNSNHIVTITSHPNSSKLSQCYVSYDGASTWEIGSMPSGYMADGARYFYNGLCFDKTTFNGQNTTDIYYSTPFLRDVSLRYSPVAFKKKSSNLTRENAGLYRSTDGGKTFEMFVNDIRVADGFVQVTNDGRLFVGSEWGLFEVNKSDGSLKEYQDFSNNVLIDFNGNIVQENYAYGKDYGKFSNIYAVYQGVTGLDCVNNDIYVQTWDGIYLVNKNGEISCLTYESNYAVGKWGQFLEVSDSNPNHMIYQFRGYALDNAYTNEAWVTFDKGKTWKKCEADANTFFLQGNNWWARERRAIIDPSNDNNVVIFSSDALFRSEDGGLNFVQTSGISNMMCGGRFNYNFYDSSLLMFSAQDYTGAVSFDSGKTFKILRFSYDSSFYSGKGAGYGNMYGGFASDRNTYFGFVSQYWQGPYYLAVTHDGGENWFYYDGIQGEELRADTEKYGASFFSSIQSYNNKKTLFAENFVSFDGGYSWSASPDGVSVKAINPAGKHEIYGVNQNGELVVSYTDGKSWKNITTGSWIDKNNIGSWVYDYETIYDLAIDHINKKVYAVVYSKLLNNGQAIHNTRVYKVDVKTGEKEELSYSLDSTIFSSSSLGYCYVRTVAVDPNATNVVYLGVPANYFITQTSLLRSVDGGKTFSNLTSTTNEKYPSKANNGGGWEVATIRVLPTGKVILACGCFGFETINPPYKLKTKNVIIPKYEEEKEGAQMLNITLFDESSKKNYIFNINQLAYAY